MLNDWRPTADIETLRQRARLLAEARGFFASRGVLEVETPILGHGGSTDPYLACLHSDAVTPMGRECLWLQTSPEFAMKRLLAAGSGPIFQLARCFRDGEVGRRHNIEFTMLEWYRPGFSLSDLMEEVQALIRRLLPWDPGSCCRHRYRDLFRRELALDPFTSELSAIRRVAGERGGLDMSLAPLEECLDLLMGLAIEPTLGEGSIDMVVDYPASQAALAKRYPDPEDGQPVAARFEVYLHGIELANGYDELTDVAEQRCRFQQDNVLRGQQGKPQVTIDERLLAALAAGMPEGSGVALGFDRLVQLALGKQRVEEVMAFATPRC